MPFDNTSYIYDHLPSRYRREDRDLFLRRFLSFVGITMDEWDGKFDAFWSSIDAETAPANWMEFWLDVLFGWTWFPRWFRTADKRRLYRNFAKHLARRGTRRGIELFLADFGITARVHTRTQPWGEFVWGDRQFDPHGPLKLIVEIMSIRQPLSDQTFWGEMVYGEGHYSAVTAPITEREIVELIRYQQPHSQSISIVWLTPQHRPTLEPYWYQIAW
jgi:phage tail-like protein